MKLPSSLLVPPFISHPPISSMPPNVHPFPTPPPLLLRGLSSASTTTCRAVATPNPCISDTPDTAPTPSRNRNKNKNAVPDPALRSTWAHRAWVAAGSAAVLAAMSNSASAAADSGSLLEPALAAALGYVLADLGSGFYHFGIDNYGGTSTPVFGPQIEAFQGHHRRPATITRRQPANNLHALARGRPRRRPAGACGRRRRAPLLRRRCRGARLRGGVRRVHNAEPAVPRVGPRGQGEGAPLGGGPAGRRGADIERYAWGPPQGALQQQLLHCEWGVEPTAGRVQGV
ncbi:fatty acid desaturase 4, chloroplastic [Iris pallida]|uniref:Fatty acid desaturase 4, chloroplastic n=1 Tax=Iris pallida TaxID=29817 RepID=A0AAX6H508_IRIPA|nr:fatty acid desaturase 4, chloroplastic [Iris pallida]